MYKQQGKAINKSKLADDANKGESNMVDWCITGHEELGGRLDRLESRLGLERR